MITGTEVRADVCETKVELLGYYIDPKDETLRSVLQQAREYRRERNRKIISKLNSVSDLNREYDCIRERADGILGRPHIADVLVDEGLVDSISEAFNRYLGAEGEAYVPMERVPAAEVISAIHEASGVASLAHHGRIRTDDIEGIVEELVAENIDAIEVPYPSTRLQPRGTLL